MNVKLLRRWGNAQPGETVTVDAVQGRWLVDHAFGTAAGVTAPSQEAFMPGGDGPDPLASGDGTRRGAPAMVKGDREGNRARPVPGSPVQFNAGVAPDQPASGEQTPPASGGDASKPDGKAPARRRGTKA